MENDVKWDLERYNKKYFGKDCFEKVTTFDQLRIRRKGLENELKEIESEIIFLEHDEDVADYRVKNKEGARFLLTDLKRGGPQGYAEFIQSYGKENAVFTDYCLTLLKNAGLVDIKKGRIEITEKGRVS